METLHYEETLPLVNDERIITDRRAGRKIEKEDALAIAREIEEKLKFSNPKASVVVAPTIGHRVNCKNKM